MRIVTKGKVIVVFSVAHFQLYIFCSCIPSSPEPPFSRKVMKRIQLQYVSVASMTRPRAMREWRKGGDVITDEPPVQVLRKHNRRSDDSEG